MIKVSHIITDNTITVNFSGNTYVIDRTNKLANEIILALKDKNYDSIPDLVDQSKKISEFSDGNFVVKNGSVYIGDWKAPQVLADRIIKFSEEDLPYEPLIKFGEKLKNNPSFRAVQQLFGFLSHNGMPITEDGNFIAYKRVQEDFKDIYSQTFDNSVGAVVSMPRNEVNEDPEVTCSNGLHIAAWQYAKNNYGSSDMDVMLEVEVDPADVVAVPRDYNNMKCRCCKYVVKAVVANPREENLLVRDVIEPCYDCDCEEDFDDEEDDEDDDCDCCEDCDCEECDTCDCCCGCYAEPSPVEDPKVEECDCLGCDYCIQSSKFEEEKEAEVEAVDSTPEIDYNDFDYGY